MADMYVFQRIHFEEKKRAVGSVRCEVNKNIHLSFVPLP